MEVIFSYSRAQALDDGVLIDVTETAKEAGIRHPTAVTAAVWHEYVRVPKEVTGQDEQGRLWDILWMFRCAISCLRKDQGSDVLLYQLLVRNEEQSAPKEVTLKAVCGPGDNMEPVITIMLPDED
jgi:hypothetical protein